MVVQKTIYIPSSVLTFLAKAILPGMIIVYLTLSQIHAQNLPAINGSFEQPVLPAGTQEPSALVPGPWNTTDYNGTIEYWTSGFNAGNGTAYNVPSYGGNQFIEMNAYGNDTLWQDLTTIPCKGVFVKFAHRGRWGADTMAIEAGPVGGPYTKLGTYIDDRFAWGYYTTATYVIPPGQTTTRFKFEHIGAYGTSPCCGYFTEGVGNFLDSVTYTYAPPGASIAVTSVNGLYTFCTNDSLVLQAPKGVHYIWNNGDTTQEIVVKKTDSFFVIEKDAVGCTDTSAKVTVTQKAATNSTTNAGTCAGQGYVFNGVTYNTSGTYTAKLTNKAGCDSIATLNLIVSHASVTNISGTICAGRVYKLPKNDTTTRAGVYTDTLLNPAGCDSIIITTLFVQAHGVTAGPDTSVCPNQLVQLYANSVPNSNYVWSPATGLDYNTISTPIATVTGNVTYTVITTSPNGCLDTATVTINMYTLPAITISPDITIPLGSTTALSVTGGATYLWSPGYTLSDPHSATPLATPLQNTQYNVTIISKDGCVLQDSVTVDVSDSGFVLVPGAFTPNGDGSNDVLSIIARGDFKLTYFNIYDRWGELVFSTRDIKTGWNGTFRGQPEPVSTYVYVLQGTGNGGSIIQKQGNITLLR